VILSHHDIMCSALANIIAHLFSDCSFISSVYFININEYGHWGTITTRISIQSIWIADYACNLKNKRGNVVDSIWSAIQILWIDLFLPLPSIFDDVIQRALLFGVYQLDRYHWGACCPAHNDVHWWCVSESFVVTTTASMLTLSTIFYNLIIVIKPY